MSYRFSIVASDKAGATAAIGAELDAVEGDDAAGKAEVLAASEAFIARLREPEDGEAIAAAVSVTVMTLDGRGVGRTAVEVAASIEVAD